MNNQLSKEEIRLIRENITTRIRTIESLFNSFTGENEFLIKTYSEEKQKLIDLRAKLSNFKSENETRIVYNYQTGLVDFVDLELDLTIIPNMGNIHLYWNGKNYDHLKVTRRQIVKHTNETILYITFEKYI